MSQYIDELHVTEDGGVIKKMIVKGEENTAPTKGQEVLVHYKGCLEDGSVFDTSYDRGEPLKVVIGIG